MKLIINADDFGYTKANTEGILEGYRKGIIRWQKTVPGWASASI